MDKRVFVSSTFIDLVEYRDKVQSTIRQLEAIDVSMENLGARDERPKAECLRLIREECDLFVGIYAHRYGFTPDGDATSITEAEYEAATVAGLPRFIYLVNDRTPWIPEFIDSGASAVKLKLFKAKLKGNHICKEFADKGELAAHVAADLGRYFSRQALMRVDSTTTTHNALPIDPKSVDEWNKYRSGIYRQNRDIFLTHVITPSHQPEQKFDVFIYLLRHNNQDLSDIARAEFFLGRYWQNRIFTVQNDGGFVGFSTSAYGEFLCTCRVTFIDGTQIYLNRYIDFEMQDWVR